MNARPTYSAYCYDCHEHESQVPLVLALRWIDRRQVMVRECANHADCLRRLHKQKQGRSVA